MDTRDGKLYPFEHVNKLSEEEQKFFKEIESRYLTSKQLRNRKVRRNDRCPCGSGKKFKKCCLRKDLL